jgi:hypothetical protein
MPPSRIVNDTFENMNIVRHRNEQFRHVIMILKEGADFPDNGKSCSAVWGEKVVSLITKISNQHQQPANSTEFEIRPLGLVVKRITSITHNAMIRSLVRFWQRAAFFARDEHVCGVV